MNSYLIPQQIGNENRFLIFTPKSLAFTLVGVCIGTVFYLLFTFLANYTFSFVKIIGVIFLVIITLIAYFLGSFNLPETNLFKITKKVGGESIDKVIKRWIDFNKGKKIYIYGRGR